jgi:hypothetical protein
MSSEGKGINSIATMHGGMRVLGRKRETWDMEGREEIARREFA